MTDARELLLLEETDAWREYLKATRNQGEQRYREVEPWAWARLQQRLRAIRGRREKLTAARTSSPRAASQGTTTRPGL